MDLNQKLKMLQLTIGRFWSYEHMYTKGKPDSYTKQFLDYMMSDEVQENVVAKMGYISIHSMKVTKDADGKVSKKSEE